MFPERMAHCSYQGTSRDVSYSYNRVPLKSKNFILAKVQKTYKKFQERPLPPEFKPKLDGPSVTWRIFSRLAMAVEYADSFASNCMIFSFEEKVGNPGQRLFLVTSPQKMWANHSSKSRHPEERCTYEVIRENHPCKLYFDLEFYTCFNSGKNGNILTDIFIKCVIASMYEQHNLLLKESDFLWLDASNDEKFSSHLILQTRCIAFQNNIHVGHFVSLLTSTLRKRIEENLPSDELWPSAEEIKNLLVKSKKEKEIFFFDEGVYTKNRNFRMYLSTKLGKKSPLVLSSCNKYVPLVHPKYEKQAVFYDSLVTYFRSQKICKILSYNEVNQKSQLNSPHSRIRIDKPGVSGCALSPFPELDKFVLGIIKDEIAVGFIRKWTYVSNAQKIIYDIGNYRFCGNIGRHHRSNNIKIVVDMKLKCYYQTCLDPECRQEYYQSEAVAVPEEFFSSNIPENFFDDYSFSEVLSTDKQNNAPDFSEELFKSCTYENLEAENYVKFTEETYEQDKENNNNTLCQDTDIDFEDFSEVLVVKNDIEMKVEDHVKSSESDNVNNPIKEAWDAFFTEDFALSQEKVNQEKNGNIAEDFSFLDDECSWDTEPVIKDNTVSLGTVSSEEELLMAEAVEAVEATINESIFLEETMF